MDAWFKRLADTGALPLEPARALDEEGFVVIRGPVESGCIEQLAQRYDAEVAAADPSDRNTGRTGVTTRVNDFVNRGPAFDPLYVHPPILEACCRVIGRPFKLSTMHARTLNPHAPAQGLHMDFPPEAADHASGAWPMVGFIFMVDAFTAENGATLFVPGSHHWLKTRRDVPAAHRSQVPACGEAGSVIVYNGSVWHGHGANVTSHPRRSIQGAYIRRDAKSGGNLPDRMRPDTLTRIGDLAKYLIA
ncbi:MAG TPA: phytanoyl-CoA dioxygenase family protein [Vicinamibacterales bacterium]|jgi:ectoine hydroxylase-related dioxygenase (phytanoyl-CoA dioxygenase family)